MRSIAPQDVFVPAAGLRRAVFTEGNEVVAFIDGADYMTDLARALEAADRALYLVGWRVTGQQWLRPTPPQMTVIDGARRVRGRGGHVRAMLYQVEGVAWPARAASGTGPTTACSATPYAPTARKPSSTAASRPSRCLRTTRST
ncbi:MAG: hypothetical protein M0Q15_00160 [Nevskia sp.]|jgi:hypothetical protein|nr:hypothetical protein [Nevskia sp.]